MLANQLDIFAGTMLPAEVADALWRPLGNLQIHRSKACG